MTTKLDPVREARARRMVLDKSTWRMDHLPMKRIGEQFEFGLISLDVQPDNILIKDRFGRPLVTFNSIDELVEAGWTVD